MFSNLIQTNTLSLNLERDWVILDCRFYLNDKEKGKQDYLKSHIPGAIYLHLDEDLSGPIIPGTTGRHPLPSVDAMTELFSSIGVQADTQVVAYDNRGGAIASRAWWMLQYLGHTSVAVLDGGWDKWVAEELLTTDEVPLRPPVPFVAKVNSSLLVDATLVDQIKNDPSISLIDSRARPRYEGKEEPIDPIAGHIPGAINLPFGENLGNNGQFKSDLELKARFEVLNNESNLPIFYCGSGVTACHNILAYQIAGFGDARLYVGSWSDWITDPTREIATKQQTS